MLLAECHAAGVEIKTGQTIQDVAKPDHFRVQTQVGVFSSSALVLGTGGLSIPKMGASGLSHRVAAQFGLPVTQTRPALVPLVFEGENLELMRGLSGLSLEIVARLGKQAFRESMIFTHRGLSGPAILQLSSYWREGAPLRLDLLPDLHADAFLIERKKSRPKAEVKTILGEVLPQRLAQAFSDRQNLATPIGGRSDKNLKEIGAFLKAWELIPSASEGYAKAEVTLGGVSTQALSSKTMQATHVPGLYVIGEAVDVTGWLGGYNFQWAWSSGWAAGSAV